MDHLKAIGVYLAILLEIFHISYINSEALQLTSETYHDTLVNNKIVLVNFYADWCMFSQQLAPIFHQAADIIHEEYQNVKLGRVNCEVEQQIALENSVSKYPTIKIYRNGKALRKEYRGARSVDSFSAFVKQQMKNAVTDVLDPADLHIDENRNTFIGYFDAKDNDAYKTFERLADEVFENVDCIACLGEGFSKERAIGENLVFKPKKISGEHESSYTGGLTDYNVMQQWLNDKANPLVREITFSNGEELTEEGLPFLLLFHRPDDVTAIQRYKNAVMRELLPERDNINFLTADGTTFAHPLHHLGKSIEDLPIICIDSFRHMYLFKNFNNIDTPGKIKQFVLDLHSGKLHTDFHNPSPDPEDNAQGHNHGQIEPQQPKTTEAPPPQEPIEVADGVIKEAIPESAKTNRKSESGSGSGEDKSQPPETIFQKLAPSDHRYTLLHWRDYSGNYRDEL